MGFRYATIVLTLEGFAASVIGLGKVEQQFFPTGDRPEVVVDVVLRQNVSFYTTDAEMRAFEDWLRDQEGVEYWSASVGDGALRFVLTLQGPTAGPHVGEVVIMTTGTEARDRLAKAIPAYSDSRVGSNSTQSPSSSARRSANRCSTASPAPTPTLCATRATNWPP